MKKLSNLIKENLDLKNYKYTINVEISGHVAAENEGNAGELVDQIVDEIDNVINYNIINIEESGNAEITENINILDQEILNDAYNSIIYKIEEVFFHVPLEYKFELQKKLQTYFK